MNKPVIEEGGLPWGIVGAFVARVEHIIAIMQTSKEADQFVLALLERAVYLLKKQQR